MTQDEPYSRGMVVIAHADDAEWGCSGTVAKWCKDGMEVVYVLCTDGSKGSSDPRITSGELIEIRHQEQLAAAKVLGVKKVVFLGYEDSMLQPTLELRRDITRQIRKYRPDILICPSPVRSISGRHFGHPDHMAAGEATLAAVFPAARDRLTFPELLAEGLEPHKVREVLVTGNRDEANKWIDVSDTIEVAVEALKQHASQIGDNDVGSSIRTSRKEVGEANGMAYAEAFNHFHLRH